MKLEVLKTLDHMMNGKCTTNCETCPYVIDDEITKGRATWDCETCFKMFENIVNLRKPEGDVWCPCYYSHEYPDLLPGEVVVGRVKEEIEKLENKPL